MLNVFKSRHKAKVLIALLGAFYKCWVSIKCRYKNRRTLAPPPQHRAGAAVGPGFSARYFSAQSGVREKLQLNVFIAHQDILLRLHLVAEACENVRRLPI